MALSLAKIEPVNFGDFPAKPQMDKEMIMRVRALNIDQNDFDPAIELLSRCFGVENTERIREFMKKNMFYLDFIQLQVYLTQGEKGLVSLNQRMDRMIDEQMKQKLAEEKIKDE